MTAYSSSIGHNVRLQRGCRCLEMRSQCTNPALAAFNTRMVEVWRHEVLMQHLRDREQEILDRQADSTCAGAATCPFHRCPGELFNSPDEDGRKWE